MTTLSLRARRGFTLIEITISMVLLLAVIGMSTQLFRRQSGAVATQAGTLDATQNSRFAINNLERELRMAGGGVLDRQPLLVMAGATAITFNADLVSVDTGDYASVYYNPDADSAAVGVLRHTNKITLPGTSTLYPDSTYTQGGLPSSAETISYWLSRDSTTSRTDEYILFRRANNRTPRVVARGIVYKTGMTVFEYLRDSAGTLISVSPAVLPLIHTSAIHGSSSDTARLSWTDSIRQVRATFRSRFVDPRQPGKYVERTVGLRVLLKNAGLVRFSSCGNAPLGVAPTASTALVNGQTVVNLRWTPSIDENTGEHDVERYAIYRRLSSVTLFDEPFASVPAGDTAYHFQDSDTQLTGQTWVYAVAAQDCTPQSSPAGVTGAVIIP
jgi:prepilin-type N-terminal cleavage/methylation domain-containing protein